MTKTDIHKLIERYFDGETTLDEERWLRQHLPSMSGDDGEIDGCLAVMGYAAAPVRSAREKRFRRHISGWTLAAASLALLVTAGGIYSYFADRDSASTFIAYSGGVQIDRAQAMQLIASQMEDFSEASRDLRSEVDDDLDDFRNLN